MITQTLVLHLVPDGIKPKIYLNQYDTGLEKLKFVLVDVNDYYEIPSGTTILFIGKKSDKRFFSYAATYSGHEVTVDVTDQMTAIPGFVDAELRMLNGSGGILGSINLEVIVERSPFKDLICSKNDLQSVDETIIDAAESSARAKEQADRAKEEADRAKTGADDAVKKATDEANALINKAKEASDSSSSASKTSADNAKKASDDSITASNNAAKAAEDARDAAIEAIEEALKRGAELAENAVTIEYLEDTESLKINTLS